MQKPSKKRTKLAISLSRLGDLPLPPEVAQRLAELGLARFDVTTADALDQHFHQVVVGRGATGTPVIANIKLAPLVTLAEELGRTVTPVQPPSRFRQDLGVALTDAHRQRMAQRTLGTAPPPPPPPNRSRPLWIGLALTFVLFLLFWRTRRRSRA